MRKIFQLMLIAGTLMLVVPSNAQSSLLKGVWILDKIQEERDLPSGNSNINELEKVPPFLTYECPLKIEVKENDKAILYFNNDVAVDAISFLLSENNLKVSLFPGYQIEYNCKREGNILNIYHTFTHPDNIEIQYTYNYILE